LVFKIPDALETCNYTVEVKAPTDQGHATLLLGQAGKNTYNLTCTVVKVTNEYKQISHYV